jgi:hypothetical protein
MIKRLLVTGLLTRHEWEATVETLAPDSGMIETKESDFGFPSLLEYATIPYAHRDHI